MRRLALLALAACGGTGGDSTAPLEPLLGPPPVPERVEAFRALAADAGWDVQDGRYTFLDEETCCDPDANCLWNNPSTPYGLYELLPSPGQTADDLMVADDGYARSYHLREDQVLVLLGTTPPEAEYFSYRSYIAWRPSPPPPKLVIGSLGPSLNHLVVGEAAGERGPFDRPLAIVTTADGAIERTIHGLLEDAGFGPTEIFDDRMVYEKVRFGLDAEADMFMAVARTAMIASPSREAEWYADPGYTLLRLTPSTPIPVTEPHPEPPLPSRGTGTDEAAWADALDALGEAIHARYPDLSRFEAESRHWWFETLDCIDEGHCSGDIRDRYYSRVPDFRLQDDQAFVVAFGVNHQRTGKAAYSNFAVDTVNQAIGLAAVNSGQMVGSARAYLPDHPQVDDLFAWIVARDCSLHPEARCMEVPTGCPGVDPEEFMLISFRAYLEEATGAAPAEGELLQDRVIRFAPFPPTEPTGTTTTTTP